MKRYVALIVALILLLSCTIPFAYAEEVTPRSSNFFCSYGTTLSKVGNGRIKIVFSTTGIGICNQLGVANYQVQKRHDDGHWEDVSGLLYGSLASGLTNYTFSRYFNGVAGETYRVKVTFLCVINNASEVQNYTSGQITAR